jgi:hypothetical protein
MGDVYLGTTRRGQQVAIKLIRGAQLDDDEFRTRFRREVRAAAKVRSRFIANLIDADPDAELPWLATEYVPGPTLSQALAAQGPLPEDEVLRLVTGVAEALHAMHRAGLVHRDVKPANVILGPDGPRLIDLGVVATIDATRLTLTGQPVGTPVYMAPEQASGSRATSAADVWALGALAYYAATGNRLFDGDHPAVVLYRVSAEEPAYDDCPAYLRPFLDACLTKDPEQRPSIGTILRSLGVAAPAGATIGVPGPGRVPDAGRAVAPGRVAAPGRDRRRARIALGSAIAVTAVLAGSAIGIWQSLDGDAARDGTGQLQATPPPQETETGSAEQPTGVETETGTGTGRPDGSPDRPWAHGTAQRLADGSCWTAAVDDVQGRLATLTLSCDQAGTSAYGDPTPNAWLGIYAVGQDGTVRQSTAAEATAQDTFWTQGNLTDPAPVTVTVTLPDVGPLGAVAVRNKDDDGWHWAAAR